MKIKNYFFFALLSACITDFLLSCASNSVMEAGKVNIVVLNENNEPVKDFEIQCDYRKANRMKNTKLKTGENGAAIFYIEDADSCLIHGRKNGYTEFSDMEIEFSKKCQIFYCQVFSCSYILDKAESCFEEENYDEGRELLDTVFCGDNQILQSVIHLYKAYGYCLEGIYDKATSELDLAKELGNEDMETTFELLEKLINKGEQLNENTNEAVA